MNKQFSTKHEIERSHPPAELNLVVGFSQLDNIYGIVRQQIPNLIIKRRSFDRQHKLARWNPHPTKSRVKLYYRVYFLKVDEANYGGKMSQ